MKVWLLMPRDQQALQNPLTEQLFSAGGCAGLVPSTPFAGAWLNIDEPVAEHVGAGEAAVCASYADLEFAAGLANRVGFGVVLKNRRNADFWLHESASDWVDAQRFISNPARANRALVYPCRQKHRRAVRFHWAKEGVF